MTYKELIDKHLGNTSLKTIYDVCDAEVKRIKIKDNSTINWWSSNLNGVYAIEYSIMEMNLIFYRLGIDKEELALDILKTKGFNKNWAVSKEPFNVLMSMCYHRGISMKNEMGDKLIYNSFVILYFRMIAGRTRHYFSNYVQNEAVARLAYDNMSNGYDLKKLGSQYRVMEKKFNMFKRNSKQYKKMVNPDGRDVVLMLNYLFSSINDYVKKGMSAAVEAEKEFSNRRGITTTIDKEGEDVGIVTGDSRYRDTLHSLIMEKYGIYHPPLLDLMESTFSTFDRGLTIKVVEELHKESLKGKAIVPLIDSIITGSYYYLHKEQVYPPFNKVLPVTLRTLRNYWAASKSADKEVKSAKLFIKTFASKNMNIRRKPVLSNIAITVPVYLFMLTILKTDIGE